MLCPRCGASLQANVQQCDNCGFTFRGFQQFARGATRTFFLNQQEQTTEGASPHKKDDVLFGTFRILQHLGGEDFSFVYKVEETISKQTYTLRLFIFEDFTPTEKEQLTLFSQRLRTIEHENIASIHHADFTNQQFYYTTDFLEGLTLKKIIQLRERKNESFRLEEIEPMLSQITSALSYLEQQQLSHGMLYTQNVFVLPEQLKLVDVGLLSCLPDRYKQRFLEKRSRDLHYFAKEIRQGKYPTTASDIYSLGLLMGEMVTAKRFSSFFETLLAVQPNIDPMLDLIYQQATTIQPQQRFASANSLFSAFQELVRREKELGEESTMEHEMEVELDDENESIIAPTQSSLDSSLLQTTPLSHFLSEEQSGSLDSSDSLPGSLDSFDVQIEDDSPTPRSMGGFPVMGKSEQRESLLDMPEEQNEVTRSLHSSQINSPPDGLPQEIEVAVPTNGYSPNNGHDYHPQSDYYESFEEDDFSQLVMLFGTLGVIFLLLALSTGLFFKFWYFPKQKQKQALLRLRKKKQQKKLTPKPRKRRTATKPKVRRDATKKRRVVLRKAPTNGRTSPNKRIKPRRLVAKKPSICPSNMAFIKAGSFRFGSPLNDESRSFNEAKNVWSKTSAYCIDRYEYPGRGKRPTGRVSWYQAKKICEAQKKRLCSAKEWERACKGTRYYRYPYGNKFQDNKCNSRTKSGINKAISRTGGFRSCRSNYQVYDMSGNVAEWTGSRFRGSLRIVRGGASNQPFWDVRCASIGTSSPSKRRSNLGFRCCKDAKK